MKPKVLKFTYTKDSGEVSNRKVITITEPSDLLLCFDVSDFELTVDDTKWILKQIQDIEAARLLAIYNAAAELGIKPLIKTFKNKGISNKTDDTKKYEAKNGLG